MEQISLIVAGVGSITGLVFSEIASKLLKKQILNKITIKFKDGQTKELKLTQDMDTEQLEKIICQTIEQKSSLSTLEALKLFLIESTSGLLIFGVFVLSSVATSYLAKMSNVLELAILFRIIEVTIFVMGAICCIAFIFNSTTVFIKSVLKRTPQKISLNVESDQNIADERRDQ